MVLTNNIRWMFMVDVSGNDGGSGGGFFDHDSDRGSSEMH